MQSEDSSLAKPVSAEVKSLYSLLKITEELLFSFALPPEVVKKYEEMKDATFVKAGLTYSPSRMWKLQRQAHNKQQKTERVDRGVQAEEASDHKLTVIDLDMVPGFETHEFKLKELEETTNVMRFELIARLEASHSINSNYQQLVEHFLNSLVSLSNYASKLIDDSNPVKETRRRQPKLVVSTDSSKPMSLSELESEHALSISKFKDMETSQMRIMSELKNELQQPVNRLRSTLEELFNIVKSQDSQIEDLKHSLVEVSQEFTLQKEADTERATEIIAKLKSDQKKLIDELEETKEAKDSERSQIVEQLTKEKEHVKAASLGAVESAKRAFETERSQLTKENQVLEAANKRLIATIEDQRKQFTGELDQLKRSHRSELQALHSSLLGESETLKSLHAKKWQEMVDKLTAKEADLESNEVTIRQLKEALRKTEGDLEDCSKSLKYAEDKLSSYMSQLPKFQQDTAELVELRAHVDELRTNESQLLEVLRHLQIVLAPVYESNKSKHKDWNERQRSETLVNSWRGWTDLVLWSEFCVHVINKLTTDNSWLVDRLTEFGRELERCKIRSTTSMPVQTSPPRQDSMLKKVWKDVKTTASAFKEFEVARHKLVEKFKTSHL